MNNFLVNFKYYWIFLLSIIFYCIGFSIHFIAQHGGTRPHYGKEKLKEALPKYNIIHDASQNDTITTESPESKYSKPDNLFYFAQVRIIIIFIFFFFLIIIEITLILMLKFLRN